MLPYVRVTINNFKFIRPQNFQTQKFFKMKKTFIYAIFAAFFMVLVGFVFLKNHTASEKNFPLIERKGELANSPEWKTVRARAEKLTKTMEQNPSDINTKLQLAAVFIQEGRTTGNRIYYDMAAMKYVNDVLKSDSLNFDALTFKATLQLAQHHFSDGLQTAQKAQQKNPYNAFIYGMLVDANVELGNYTEAVDNSDKMMSIRPDLRSYSRVSYLREIHGDYAGAIEAMNLAVSAGAPGDEGTEWARVHLGQLFEYVGDAKNAEMQYLTALNERPNYGYAYAGLARLATAKKEYPKAIALYQKADSLVMDCVFQESLVDVYTLAQQSQQAEAAAQSVLAALNKDAQSGLSDESIGHYADRELAHAYLEIKNYDKAVEHALIEYNRRPANIDVNETVAWVYFKKGDAAKALPYIQTALKTKSQNPTLNARAGLILAQAGENAAAKKCLTLAFQNNAYLYEPLKVEAQKALAKL